ncbi:MAG TPA: NAD(P)-binding oxidoreductase [Bacteroidota bacterium]|nr:NAD(P)-binding oxidoreductase [Bacteroidota bacterium]
MSRLVIFGATGSLGSHVLHLALAAEHQVTVFVRNPSRLSPQAQTQVTVLSGDLSTLAAGDVAQLVSGHDAVINCAGRVNEGQTFVDLIDRLVTGVESIPNDMRPVCWFIAGVAILDLDSAGRKGVDLPRVKSTYWPHRVNFQRLARSGLNWRLLCPGPMVEEPALGLNRLRITLDRLPVELPAFARSLPGPLMLPLFAHVIPEMIVPYADAAALMLANLRDDSMARHRVGLALPLGTRGKKSQWAAR